MHISGSLRSIILYVYTYQRFNFSGRYCFLEHCSSKGIITLTAACSSTFVSGHNVMNDLYIAIHENSINTPMAKGKVCTAGLGYPPDFASCQDNCN